MDRVGEGRMCCDWEAACLSSVFRSLGAAA
jgi:hypothetical protein